MASVSGGYNSRFLDSPPDEYICIICHSVCRDPQQVTCCAKLYCQTCLEEYRRNKGTCPTCRKRIIAFQDKVSHRRIKTLKVSCDNEDAGCTWSGELGSLLEHTMKCEFAETSCTNNCSRKVLRRDLESHLTNDCPRRKQKCLHCDEEVEYSSGHQEECPHVVVTCPNVGCRVRMKRCDVSSHRDMCPKEVVNCPYAKVGCKEILKRKDCQKHGCDFMEHHLQLAVERVASLESEVKKPVVPVVFKMSNFSKLKDRNSTWYSREFYSHAGGYMMTLCVYANGSGSGIENCGHVSIYLCLAGGEYDNNLVWPFHGTITIELLNQLENHNHKSWTVSINPDMVNAKRPPEGDRNSGGLGKHKFASHADLQYTRSSNCQYLKDDSLHFRVSNIHLDTTNKVRSWLAL